MKKKSPSKRRVRSFPVPAKLSPPVATAPDAASTSLTMPMIQQQVRGLLDELNRKIPPPTHPPSPVRDPGERQPWMDSDPEKRCKVCKDFKLYKLFPRVTGTPDGYADVCESCVARGEFRISDVEIPLSPAPGRTVISTSPGRGIGRPRLTLVQFKVKRLLAAAAAKAIRWRVPIDLHEHVQDIEMRVQKGKCEISGALFDLDHPLSARAPSIYLKVPDAGLVYSNIQIICWAMNCALGTWGGEELRDILKGWSHGQP